MNAAPGWGSWSFDPVLWIVLAAAGAFYVSMLRRVRRTTGKTVGPGHWIPYFSGLAVLLVALGSPLDEIGDSWLLWAHMVQHVLLADIAPPRTWLGTSLYSLYATGPHAYGMTAVTDQRLAGATMCLIEFLVFGIALVVVFVDALGRDERAQALGELASQH